MGEIIVYLLKTSACLAVFYLFYKLLLSKETFFTFNRYLLIAILLLSFVIPLLVSVNVAPKEPTLTISYNSDGDSVGNIFLSQDFLFESILQREARILLVNKLIKIGLVLYFVGILVSLFFLTRSYVSLFRLFRTKDKRIIYKGNIKIIIHQKEISPLSWMKTIAISEKDFNENGEEIITHETAHVERYHSFDLIIGEIVKILHWFNPASYLLKQELQAIHEYQADRAVISRGVDAKNYQMLLIKKAVGDNLYSVANSFNHSKLKNRITMITKKKSKKSMALKALFVAPLSLLAIVTFANEKVSSVLEPISEFKVNNIDVNIEHPQDNKKTVKTVGTIVSVKNGDTTSKVISSDSLKITGTYTIISDKDTVFVNRTNMRDDNNSVIKLRGFYSNNSAADANILFIVDGKIAESNVINTIDPDSIASISVLKNKIDVQKEYGVDADGKEGFIIITTKSPDYQKVDREKIKQDLNKAMIESEIVVKKNVEEFKQYLKSEEFKEAMKSLKGEIREIYKDIEKSMLTKEQMAELTNEMSEAYDKAMESLKEKLEEHEGGFSRTLIRSNVDVNPESISQKQVTTVIEIKQDQTLYIVDGVINEEFSLSELPEGKEVKNIKYLDPSKAQKKYGEKGKNGAVEVKLKNIK